MDISNLAAVAMGAGCGAACRYQIAQVAPRLWGTWIANMVGCGLLGLLTGFPSPNQGKSLLLLGLIVGVTRGLSTWSSFAVEVVDTWQENRGQASSYLGSTLLGGLISYEIAAAVATHLW
ncbi:fluoride efflux transporter FluC [Corynebacterium choanae]|uniref:Fluoride-specific ion channel FluC n=1 Tax=Corynebacterium choanae TaxID=1862358 RepID=A0A3G6J536_9CORY|nr:CrcB family protein [Corynebacterium choanae]AZA12853.1 camphor resistance protein CrcB [Corynebacterium choanae]